MTRETDVVSHYGSGDLMNRILAALEAAGVDPNRPTPTDLAPVDEFHIGGIGATEDFAAKLPFKVGDRLLDVGCGIGGTARYFAQACGAHVTGLDLTPDYVEVAGELSRRTGQADETSFDVGSALSMPYDDASFDGAITLHVAMNIADRDGLYREVARVLKPGATFGVYDVMKGNAEPLDFPVPWATTADASHVITPAETRAHLEAAGFEVVEVEDRIAHAKTFFEKASAAAKAAGGPPPVGLQLLTGATHGKKFGNLLAAVGDGRLVPAMIVARKS